MKRHIWKATERTAGTVFIVGTGLHAGGVLGWALVLVVTALDVFEHVVDARLIEAQREALELGATT